MHEENLDVYTQWTNNSIFFFTKSKTSLIRNAGKKKRNPGKNKRNPRKKSEKHEQKMIRASNG